MLVILATFLFTAIVGPLQVEADTPEELLGDNNVDCDLYGPDSGVNLPDGVFLPDAGVLGPDEMCRPVITVNWADAIPGQVVQVGALQPADWSLDEFDCYYPYDLRIRSALPPELVGSISLGLSVRSIQDITAEAGVVIPNEVGTECVMVVWDKWVDELSIGGSLAISHKTTSTVSNRAGGGWGDPASETTDNWWSFEQAIEMEYEFATEPEDPGQQEAEVLNVIRDCEPSGWRPWICYADVPNADLSMLGVPQESARGYFVGKNPLCWKWRCIKLFFTPVLRIETEVWGQGTWEDSANTCETTFRKVWSKAPKWYWTSCGNVEYGNLATPQE